MANRPKRTPKKDDAFFAALAAGLTVSAACGAAGYKRRRVYQWRADDEEFADRFREADEEAVDRMEAEADRRAVDGVDKPVFYRGQLCGSVREFSDTLLMFRLKAKRPDRYRENSKVEHTGGVKVVRLPSKEDAPP